MAERKRVALSYTYNEFWIGGTYYIENLVCALNTLPDTQKPHLVILVSGPADMQAAKNKLVYPYISLQLASGERNRVFQFANKVTRRVIKANIFSQKIKGLDAAFPYYDCVQQSLARKKIYWIADFQESFAQDFFTADAIAAIKKHQDNIQSSNDNLILSSNDALQHFKALYPQHTVKSDVLPFAVTHPPYQHIDTKSLLLKHGLPDLFFICPNQFWKHKNQLSVLKAVDKIKKGGLEITVAFTGKTSDYRHPDYFLSLEKYVADHNLESNIKFLGFIDRKEQLKLMSESITIIQPSLFEGWSTVVEDAKAMNKALIASDIKVHREQLIGSTASFFDPVNTTELADLLQQATAATPLPPLFENHNYPARIQKFGRDFLAIINN
nr:glycosyltransferase [uncultured Mucilaginibacter sp.]